MHLSITPTLFVTNPKYFQTLLFTLVARCLQTSSRVAHTTCATVDQFCVTNLVFHYCIIEACTYMCIYRYKKFLYWYHYSKFHIDILVYRHTYITHPYISGFQFRNCDCDLFVQKHMPANKKLSLQSCWDFLQCYLPMW